MKELETSSACVSSKIPIQQSEIQNMSSFCTVALRIELLLRIEFGLKAIECPILVAS